MPDASVEYFVLDGVATVTFQTPQHNALPSPVLSELEAAIKQVGEDTAARVVVLKSGGDRTFCAGASFDEMLAISNAADGKKFFMGFARVINALRECPKPVIGRVQGKAVGGGVGLASATDYCLATKYASVKLSEISIGIGPFVIGPAVERKLGLSGFSQLTLDAENFFDASWAKEKGLYQEVHGSAEELDGAVDKLSRKLASYNPDALIAIKTMFYEGVPAWRPIMEKRAETSGRLVLSDFTKERLKGFK